MRREGCGLGNWADGLWKVILYWERGVCWETGLFLRVFIVHGGLFCKLKPELVFGWVTMKMN